MTINNISMNNAIGTADTGSTQVTKSSGTAQANEIAASTKQTMGESQGQTSGEPSEDKVVKSIEKVNKLLKHVEVGIQYEKHEATNRMIIRLVDKSNDEVIKEIPSEEILDMAAAMYEQAGLFIDEKM